MGDRNAAHETICARNRGRYASVESQASEPPYTETHHDGSVHLFNSEGRLTKVQDPSGNALTYYRANALDRNVTKIVTADGNHGVHFMWDLNKAARVTKVRENEESARRRRPSLLPAKGLSHAVSKVRLEG